MIKNIVTSTTGNYENELKKLRLSFEKSDAIIIGAGSDLSASAGYDFAGERLKKHFGDFVHKYGMTDMYTGCLRTLKPMRNGGPTGHGGRGSTAMKNICLATKPAKFYILSLALVSTHRAL